MGIVLLNDDFLLTTDWAKRLFHEHAEHMPIIDYHCHLVPAEICEDKGYENLAQVWLYDNGFGDHYKWRLLRANGTPESVIRGDDDYAKYLAFVDALQKAPGNPIYEWSHLELRRVFGIDLQITRANAQEIWDRANVLLATPEFHAKGLIKKFNVKCICTTDDPASDLAYHKRLAAEEEQNNGFRVLPTFRPDGLMGIDAPGFPTYIAKLAEATGAAVSDWKSLKAAAEARVEYFHEVGGRLADHGANTFYFTPASDDAVDGIVRRALSGEAVTPEEVGEYQTALTLALMAAYERHNWVLQIHGNCFRNDSTLGFEQCGPDCGFDSVGDQPDFVFQLKRLFDAAQQAGALPRIILYSLNDTDWLAAASLCGSFQGGCKMRMQFGNAWWFNDTLSGMEKQITMFAEQGLLGNFTGMLTDSRSFLSYPRHEYFRRVLCRVLGRWVEEGKLPDDDAFLGAIVEDVCYNNAYTYFGFFDAE